MPDPTPDSPLDRVLEDQVIALLSACDELRLAPPEAIHDARVALRRLRSSLKGFRPLLSDPSVDVLADDLRWLAGELAPARDLQVALARVQRALEWIPVEAAGVLALMSDDLDLAYARAAAALTEPRIDGLQGRLQRLLVGKSGTGTPEQIRARVALQLDRVLADSFRLEERPTAELHDLRKLAKRCRAMLAAVAEDRDVLPARSGAGRVLRRLSEMQDLLGEHQDAVTAAELLHGLAAREPHLADAAIRLAEHEEAEAAALRRAVPAAAERLREACRRMARRTPDVHVDPPSSAG